MANVIVAVGFGVFGRAIVALLTQQGYAVVAVDVAPPSAGSGARLALRNVNMPKPCMSLAGSTRG